MTLVKISTLHISSCLTCHRASKDSVIVFEDSTSRGSLDPAAGYKGIQFEGKALAVNSMSEGIHDQK